VLGLQGIAAQTKEVIMRDFIITAIIALAAAKAKTQTENNRTDQPSGIKIVKPKKSPVHGPLDKKEISVLHG